MSARDAWDTVNRQAAGALLDGIGHVMIWFWGGLLGIMLVIGIPVTIAETMSERACLNEAKALGVTAPPRGMGDYPLNLADSCHSPERNPTIREWMRSLAAKPAPVNDGKAAPAQKQGENP